MKVGFAIALLAVAMLCACALAQEKTAGDWIKKSADLLEKGYFEEALNASDEAIKLDPQNAEAWSSRGAALNVLGNYNDSIRAYEKGLDVSNRTLKVNYQDARAWYVKGEILAGLFRNDEALQDFDRAIEINPKDIDFWSAKASVLSMIGITTRNQSKFNESLKAYDKAIELDPKKAETWWLKGNTLGIIAYGLPKKDQTKAFEDALQAYNKSLELDSNLVEAWDSKGGTFYALAMINNDTGKFNESLQAYSKAIELTSANQSKRLALALEGKAVTLSQMGSDLANSGRQKEAESKYEEALKNYDRAIELDPTYVGMEAQQNRAALLQEMGKYNESSAGLERSLEPYNKMLDADQKNAVAWLGKGIILMEQGNYEDAVSALDNASESDPKYVLAWVIKGQVLSEDLGRYNESIKAFDIALQMDPKDIGSLLGKGNAMLALGRYDEALLAYNKTLEIDPQLSRGWYGQGEALREQGKFNESIRSYEKSIELNPKQPQYSLIGKGLALDSLGRHEEARIVFNESLKDYDAIIKRNPKNPEILYNEGNALRGLGRYEEALLAYENALVLNPNYIRAWLGKVLDLRALGRNSEADAAYSKARALGYKSDMIANASSGNESSIEELAVRLLESSYAGDFELQKTQLLVGKLPDMMPVDLAIPEGARIVGSKIQENDIDIVLDVNLTPEKALDFYREKMPGWNEVDTYGQSRGFAPNRTEITLCQGRKNPSLTIAAYPVENGPTDVRININMDHRYSPCRTTGDMDNWMKPLPKLVAPADAKEFNQGFSSSGGDPVGTTVSLETSMNATALIDHYGAQLKAANWTKQAEGYDSSLAWGTWTVEDEDGLTWRAILWALDLPGTTNERFVGVQAKLQSDAGAANATT